MSPQSSPPSTTLLSMPPPAKPPELVFIPEGDTIMGTSAGIVRHLVNTEEWAEEWYTKDMFRIEQPQHKVRIKAFEISRFPVTNAEYHLFTWESGYRVPRFWGSFHYNEDEADHPVVGISREDAQAYIEWLSGELNMNYRLPSEAEWERAARGEDDRIYPWGNTFDPWRCNTSESGRRGTTTSTNFTPGGDSPWGVVDMVGNVWEWTATAMRPYPYRSEDGRDDLLTNKKELCVIRGGSWYYTRKLARCSAREAVLPTFISPALGFRLARTSG
jgi:toxoflavin biosynthesis protein ToxD